MFFDQDHKIFIPTKVKELEGKDIVEVKSGGFFYLCLTRDGKLYGWGTTKHAKFGYTG
jgi:alpha-tubulin suppressor-like RCC1 family protein